VPDAPLRRADQFYSQGNLEEAQALYEETLRSDPSSRHALRGLALTLNSLGEKRYRAGDLNGAADYLEEAIEHWPREATFHLNLGLVHFHRGELYGARREAEKALEIREGHPQAHELLGDISYQEGYLSRALPEWEAAMESGGAHSSRLGAKIEKARRELEAESSFGREVSVHFTLQYDDSVPDDLADAVLEELEEAYDMLGDELGSYPEGDIPVILYPRIVYTEITMNPLWVAGSFDGKIRLPLSGLRSPGEVARIRPILTHELSHAFIRGMAPRGLPPWFQEGLAEHFEGYSTEQAVAHFGRYGRAAPRTLRGIDDGLRGRAGPVEASYLASLVAVRILIEEEGFWSVRRILEAVGSGTPFRTALEEEARRTLAELEADLAAALR
jgi:tetratricopeptide (TPR) repeat protein